MILTAKAVRTLQAVAITVGLAVFLWSTGLPTLVRFAQADSITNASDTLTESAPSTVSNHTFVFTLPNGLSIGQTIEITFPTAGGEFVFPALAEDDVDIDVNGNASSTQPLTAAAGVWGVSTTSSSITFETPTDSGVSSSSVITIRVGTNAVDSGTGANQITNPTGTGSYGIDIGGTMQDSGQVRVAIVDLVTVSASVDTSLTFTVNGVANGATVNTSPTTTATTTTATTLPFETLQVGTSKTLAHDLTVATNASNGYTVTAQITLPLQSTLGDTIDGFADGSDTNTPSAWSSPSGTLADTDTYGHWGMTSDDFVAGRSSEFSADTWVAASTSPIIIMGHTGPADGVEAGTGAARVGFQAEITALQEASDSYTTSLRYVATPTF